MKKIKLIGLLALSICAFSAQVSAQKMTSTEVKTINIRPSLKERGIGSWSKKVATFDSLRKAILSTAVVVPATVTATQFRLSALNTAPANASATGTQGEIRIVDGFIYVCTATNTWKRAAISTW